MLTGRLCFWTWWVANAMQTFKPHGNFPGRPGAFKTVCRLSRPSGQLRTNWRLSGPFGSFPVQLKTFRAVWRLSRTSENFPVHLETFQSNMKLSRPYQDFPDHLETTCYPQEERNFHPIKQTGYLSKPLHGQNSINTSKYQLLHANLHVMCNRLHSVCISLHSECKVHIVCVEVHTAWWI